MWPTLTIDINFYFNYFQFLPLFLIFHIGLNGFNGIAYRRKKYGLHRWGNKRKISASVQIKKPHLPVFILKIDKCGEIWLRKFLTVSDHFALFFAVVPSFSSLASKKEESASLSTSFAILPSLCASISLTLFLRQGASPNPRLPMAPLHRGSDNTRERVLPRKWWYGRHWLLLPCR